MLGIIIATHGTMSEGIKDAVATIVGMVDGIHTVSLFSDKVVEELGNEIKDLINEVDEGEGVVILTDLVSASPYNQSMMAISQLDPEQQERVHIIGGVSLPMVLEAVNHRILNTPIEEAVQAIEQQGAASIGSWKYEIDSEEAIDDDDDF